MILNRQIGKRNITDLLSKFNVNSETWHYKKDSIREIYSYNSFLYDLKYLDYYVYYLKSINDKYEFITIAIMEHNRYEKLNILEGFQIG